MERIKLWENGTPYYNPEYGQPEPYLLPFTVPEKKDENGNTVKTGCVIVCPGGGYSGLAEHEANPIAEMFNAGGISSFVLKYRVHPYHHPVMMEDITRAVRYVRYNADRYNIDPEKISVCGFSAGGHLAVTSMLCYDDGKDGDEIDAVSSRPDGVILSYAVITLMHDYTHEGTRSCLIGGLSDEEELAVKLSGERSLRDDCPPVFMWHTEFDDAVNVNNVLNFAKALREKLIPMELHIFETGAHGVGLAENLPDTKQWTTLATNWLKRQNY